MGGLSSKDLQVLKRVRATGPTQLNVIELQLKPRATHAACLSVAMPTRVIAAVHPAKRVNRNMGAARMVALQGLEINSLIR